MVFISFPTNTTNEEEALLKKYEKLEKKKSSFEKAAKPEPEVVATTHNKPLEAKDAKKVIEKLKKTGQLQNIIISNVKKSEFKRKIPPKASNSNISREDSSVEAGSRDIITYEDDLFS